MFRNSKTQVKLFPTWRSKTNILMRVVTMKFASGCYISWAITSIKRLSNQCLSRARVSIVCGHLKSSQKTGFFVLLSFNPEFSQCHQTDIRNKRKKLRKLRSESVSIFLMQLKLFFLVVSSIWCWWFWLLYL